MKGTARALIGRCGAPGQGPGSPAGNVQSYERPGYRARGPRFVPVPRPVSRVLPPPPEGSLVALCRAALQPSPSPAVLSALVSALHARGATLAEIGGAMGVSAAAVSLYLRGVAPTRRAPLRGLLSLARREIGMEPATRSTPPPERASARDVFAALPETWPERERWTIAGLVRRIDEARQTFRVDHGRDPGLVPVFSDGEANEWAEVAARASRERVDVILSGNRFAYLVRVRRALALYLRWERFTVRAIARVLDLAPSSVHELLDGAA